MTTAKRTGDDDSRIVHGGELPEDDGSLDDVVVDQPSQKHPDELWTHYFLRRLSEEGVFGFSEEPGDYLEYVWGLEVGKCKISCYINLKDLTKLELHDYAHFVYDQLDKKKDFGIHKKKDYFNLNLVDYEEISLDLEGHPLYFDFRSTEDNHAESKPFILPPKEGDLPEPVPDNWLYIKYRNKGKHPAEQVIEDLVRYVKEETGIKK